MPKAYAYLVHAWCNKKKQGGNFLVKGLKNAKETMKKLNEKYPDYGCYIEKLEKWND